MTSRVGLPTQRDDHSQEPGQRDWGLIDPIIEGLSARESALLYKWVVAHAGQKVPVVPDIVPLLLAPELSPSVKMLVGWVVRRIRDTLAGGESAQRDTLPHDLEGLAQKLLPRALANREPLSIAIGDSGPVPKTSTEVLPQLTNVEFVLWLYDTLAAPPLMRSKFLGLVRDLERRVLSRSELINRCYTPARQDGAASEAPPKGHDPETFHIMGTGEQVTRKDWDDRVAAIHASGGTAGQSQGPRHRFAIRTAPSKLVSVITSLYRGGSFIEGFLHNITSQTCFSDYAELIIIDADSPDGESRVIEKYLKDFSGIKYRRLNFRCGIYEAWNLAIGLSVGAYVTNANVDDLRRNDSLELQLATFDNLPFVDVVYQDFYYSFDPAMPFEQVAAVGYRSHLPLVTPANLFRVNSPHNAPMWRKSLHDELGWFDERLQSAGDYDFWMRCAWAGKQFYKINDPHLVYYQNPLGVSTRADTRGYYESREIHRRYQRKLVGPALQHSFTKYCREDLDIDPNFDDGTQDRAEMLRLALLKAANLAHTPGAGDTAE